MPDGSKQPSPSVEAPPRAPARRGGFLQRLLVLVVVAVAAVLGGREVHNRLTHVYETDARVDGELVTVSSRVSGWVTDIAVQEGDRVRTGQVLARIDDRESKLLVDQLQAQMDGIGAEHTRLLAERRLVDAQTSTHYKTQVSRMQAAKASVSALEPQLELARSELARSQSLFEKHVIPRQQLDQARATERKIDGQHRMAVAEQAEAGDQLQEARADRARLDVIDGDIAMLTHRAAQLRARLDQQKLDMADRTIRSQVDGVVDRTFVQTGEYVTPGQRLLIVHDPRRVWIEANVKETDMRKLRIGQPVAVSVDAYPDHDFHGKVVSIGDATTASFALLPNPNPSGNFTKITQRLPVRIGIEQQGNMLRPGMMVEISIDVRHR